MSLRSRIVSCSILAAALVTQAAYGDGECGKGYRDTTAAERATMTSVLEGAKAALPTAPQGWVIVGDEQISVAQSLCRDGEEIPWTYSFTRHLQRIDNQAARDRAIRDAAAAMQADMATKQPRLDAISAQMNALTPQLVAAAEASDFARADAINQQIATLQQQYKQILDEGDVTETSSAAMNETNRDVEMTITVTINPRTLTPPADATRFNVPGAQVAFRENAAVDEVRGDRATILLGHWRTLPNGRLRAIARENVAPTAAHSMMVGVNADAGRIMQTIDAIKITALDALLAH